MDIEEIKKILAMQLKPNRYRHSLGVMQTAAELAVRYGVSPMQAALAGLLHDCARIYEDSELIKRAREAGIAVDAIELAAPLLLHAPLGAALAASRFGITDEAVLQAIRLHTTGGQRMSVLSQILYLADMIEPNRDYSNVETLRSAAERDLNEALLLAFNQSIQYVIARGQLLHPHTIQARNALLLGRLQDGQKA